MYQIKQKPEDFVVEELLGVDLKESGDYIIFELKKRNYTTERAIQQICDSIRIPRKYVGYAGSKDKVAITTQFISIFRVKKENIGRLKLKDIELKFKGCSDKPISLGDLKGNKFKIIVRSTSKPPSRTDFIPNYFDEQRFSKNNAEIGKAILKKDFKRAADLISEASKDDAKILGDYLKKKSNDYVGALRLLPKKILMLYIHAFQSSVFNETVNEHLKLNKNKKIKEIKNIKIPLPGFGTEFSGEIGEIQRKILDREGVSPRDFIIRSLPELSSEGNERSLFAEIKNLKINEIKKEKEYLLEFELPKGSYATMVVKYLFS